MVLNRHKAGIEASQGNIQSEEWSPTAAALEKRNQSEILNQYQLSLYEQGITSIPKSLSMGTSPHPEAVSPSFFKIRCLTCISR